MSNELAPLRNLLDSVLSRLEAVETKVGIEPTTRTTSRTVGGATSSETASSPALEAYDRHVAEAVVPLCTACDALPGLKEKDIGTNLKEAWDGIRIVVELASRCQKPTTGSVQEVLTPHLKTTQDAIFKIRQARLDRDYDNHQKALMEMLTSLSWILITPPPQPPTSFVKDTLGATEFWSNKIRKQYKSSDKPEAAAQIEFCDKLKGVILDLTAYTKEFHLSGLCWNPRGVPFKEGGAVVVAAAESKCAPSAASASAGGGGIGAIMNELASKKTGDGASAATGLRKVARDQQTWRKEYKKSEGAATPVPSPTATAAAKVSPAKKGAPTGKPVCEFEDRGKKWKVEHHTKDTAGSGGHIKIKIKDAKEQIYIYKCQNVTVEITGKLKTITVDDCTKVNVVFSTAISSCEVVNSKRVQLQTMGVCPSFTIDTTDGCMIYLGKETLGTTNIVASKSSEMNVCFPDENGEMKELPIPEQFVHKLVNGSVKSEVSDLYH